MSDKELMTLAAKAAGYEIEPHPNARVIRGLAFILHGRPWNPLTDDGDALRLAVRLGLALDRTPHRCWAMVAGNSDMACATEDNGDDSYAATRRAIVRAAAEIGRGR